MDAEFFELGGSEVDSPEINLGFTVQDENGDFYDHCFVKKEFLGNNFPSDPSDTKPNPLVPVIANLKQGDRVRLLGKVTWIAINDDRLGFSVDQMKMIETAAEKKAREEATDNHSDLSQ
jgi:hypothetical protein